MIGDAHVIDDKFDQEDKKGGRDQLTGHAQVALSVVHPVEHVRPALKSDTLQSQPCHPCPNVLSSILHVGFKILSDVINLVTWKTVSIAWPTLSKLVMPH